MQNSAGSVLPGDDNRPRKVALPGGRYRYLITVVLACVAIGLEVYYSICSGSCSYLHGTVFGIELQYIGIACMVLLIVLSILKQDLLIFLIVSAAVGIEFYLIGFQVWYNTYCAYCLAFGGIVFLLYAVNFVKRRLFYSLFFMAIGLIGFALIFKGSLAPTYTYTMLISW